MTAIALTIHNTSIRQDEHGRYCLNDLHRASGGEKSKSPSYWLSNQQTSELISELQTTAIPVVTIEGRKGGTFALKELVYSYAMWISPKFHLSVIKAYDALVTGKIQEPQTITKSQQGDLHTIVANKARSSGKPNAYYWSRYQNHFKLASYKDTPAHKFEEARQYLLRLEGDGDDSLISISKSDLKTLVIECSKAVIGVVGSIGHIPEKPKLDPNAERTYGQLGLRVNEYENNRIEELARHLNRKPADVLRYAVFKLADEILGE